MISGFTWLITGPPQRMGHNMGPSVLIDTTRHADPKSRDAKPRGSPPFYLKNAGGETRVKPGVWRPEMWAQMC
jgi:hypothetical protein